MQPSLQAQASQAAAQGQAQLANYNSQAGASKAQYGTFQGQAQAAQNQVGDYTNYMANAGSGGNQYNAGLNSQLGQLGYDPAQMTAARGNLNQSQGAMSAYSDFANQAASKFGLNAGGFAAANSGALQGINNNIASNQGVVNGLTDLYKTAQTGANQYAGQQVQSENNTLAGYQNVYKNAADQRDQAASMMNFYDQLAQQQGGMNGQMQQYYAAAQQAMASANQAMAQSAYLASQTTEKNLQNQGTQAQLTQSAAAAAAENTATQQSSVGQYYKNVGVKNNGQTDPNSGQKIATTSF
jgi:hypothetical protein